MFRKICSTPCVRRARASVIGRMSTNMVRKCAVIRTSFGLLNNVYKLPPLKMDIGLPGMQRLIILQRRTKSLTSKEKEEIEVDWGSSVEPAGVLSPTDPSPFSPDGDEEQHGVASETKAKPHVQQREITFRKRGEHRFGVVVQF